MKNILANKSGISLISLLFIVVICIIAIILLFNINNHDVEPKENQNFNHTEYTDINGDIAIIPEGFKIVDGLNIIKNGLVIEDNSKNQFVWIPVSNINDMIITNNNSETNYSGKLYLTELDKNSMPPTGEYKEPAIVTIDSKGNANTRDAENENLKIVGLGGKSVQYFYEQMQKEFNSMVESVKKYKGFYIGRYETACWNSTICSKSGQEDLGGQSWYTMYSKQKELYSNSSDSVSSGMIWGCQFDQVLKFIEKAGYNISDSKTWGNHKDSVGNASLGAGTLQFTGFNEYWKACNIYDLAGNICEFTMESFGSSVRICRGGIYAANGSGNFSIEARVGYSPLDIGSAYGSRLQLYIK